MMTRLTAHTGRDTFASSGSPVIYTEWFPPSRLTRVGGVMARTAEDDGLALACDHPFLPTGLFGPVWAAQVDEALDVMDLYRLL
jgi:hypothetical protein